MLKIIFFPRTPVRVIMLLLLISIVIVNKLGFKSMVRTNLFFLPATLFSILFIFFANFGNFTAQRIFPIFGNGLITTFVSGLSNLFAFSGLAYLYFIPPYLKDNKDLTKIGSISVGISSIFLLISVTTLLLMFPLIASSEEILPLYLASRFIEFGRFFQRLDAIFVFSWITSMVAYLSIALFFVNSIFQKVTNIGSSNWTIGVFASIAFGIGLLPKDMQQIALLSNQAYKYIVLILVIAIGLGILIFANIKHLVQQKKKGLNILEEGKS